MTPSDSGIMLCQPLRRHTLFGVRCSSSVWVPWTGGAEHSLAANRRERHRAHRLSFVQPQNNALVPAGVVHIELQLDGATIVRQTTTHITPTTGHIHFSINDKLVAMNYSTVQDLSLQKGLYTLTAEFVAADHFPFNPRVTTTIVVSVQ